MPTNKKGYMGRYYKQKRQEIIDELGGRCIYCGSTYRLELHHLQPLNGDRPKTRTDRLKEWQQHKKNLAVLCHNCHCNVHGMERWYER